MKKGIKKTLLFVLVISYKFCLIESYQYQLALCAIFQNEAPYMKEWIEFYKLIGVEHFYLYNNFSQDNYKEVLAEYVKQNVVEVIDWPVVTGATCGAQQTAYQDVITRAKGKVKWMVFVDLDEFLFPVEKNNLLDFLKDYGKYGAVCANWVFFGTSNVQKIPDDGLIIEYLTHCDSKGNKIIKSIVQLDKITNMNGHYASFKKGFFQVNADKIKFNGPFSPYISLNKIRVNHYWTRDIKYLYEKKLPRVNNFKENQMAKEGWYIPGDIAAKMKPTDWCLQNAKYMNQNVDKTIQKYLMNLKENVFRKIT